MKRHSILIAVVLTVALAFFLGNTALACGNCSAKDGKTTTCDKSACGKTCKDKGQCPKAGSADCKGKGQCSDACKAECAQKGACAKNASGACKPADCKHGNGKPTSGK